VQTQRLPGISEILRNINDLESGAERQEALTSHWPNTVLIGILKYMFDPEIQFELPEGDVKFKPNPRIDDQSALYREFKRLPIFMRGVPQYANLVQKRRELLFVQLLETVDAEDAKLLVAMKDKKSPYYNITRRLVAKSFPGLVPWNGNGRRDDDEDVAK
jgi:hypothetical protein